MCLILFNNNYKLNMFKSCENLWIFLVKVHGYILVINFILMYPNSLQGYSKHQFSIHEIKLIDHFIKQNFLYLSRKKITLTFTIIELLLKDSECF